MSFQKSKLDQTWQPKRHQTEPRSETPMGGETERRGWGIISTKPSKKHQPNKAGNTTTRPMKTSRIGTPSHESTKTEWTAASITRERAVLKANPRCKRNKLRQTWVDLRRLDQEGSWRKWYRERRWCDAAAQPWEADTTTGTTRKKAIWNRSTSRSLLRHLEKRDIWTWNQVFTFNQRRLQALEAKPKRFWPPETGRRARWTFNARREVTEPKQLFGFFKSIDGIRILVP